MESTPAPTSTDEPFEESLTHERSRIVDATVANPNCVEEGSASTTIDASGNEDFGPKTNLSKFLRGSENFLRRLTSFRTMFRTNRRRNEILLFLSLCCSFLSTFLHSSILNGGKLQIRKQPPPRRFFSVNSPVRDFYDGNEAMLHNFLSRSEVTLVIYYAPWSTACVEAKFHFDRLARTFGRSVDFVAVNCWDPGGQCKKIYKIFSYPVVMLYSQAIGSRGIYYNHILSSDYIHKYLLNALRPLVVVNSREDANRRIFTDKVHVIGYFDLSQRSGLEFYESFHYVSLRALENDALRDRASFSAVTNFSTAQDFNLTVNGAIRMFHKSLLLNDTATMYTAPSNRSSYDVTNLLNWIFDKDAQKANWYHTKHAKDERLFEIYNENPALVLFTPRRPLFGPHADHLAFSEAALRYFDCESGSRDLSLNVQSSILALRSKYSEMLEFWSNFRTTNCKIFDAKITRKKCGSVTKKFYANETCCKSLSNRSFRQCPAKNENFGATPASHDKILSPPCSDAYRNFQTTHSTSNSAHHLNCGIVKLAQWLKYPSLNSGKLFAGFAVENQSENWFKATSLENFGMDRLSCALNTTLNFFMIDTDHEKFHAEKLGITLNSFGSAVGVIEAKTDTVFTMPSFKQLSVAHLSDFVLNYTRGLLPRHMKSQKNFWPMEAVKNGGSPADCAASVGNKICIEQITSATFEKLVVNSAKDTVVMYQVPWCGMCQQIYHIFQMTSFYFRSQRDQLQFVTIDADQNDLPWQYTVDSFPTIVYFKVNRSGDTTVYPRTLPYNLPNFISFVLSRMDWSDRWRFSLNFCSKKCLAKNLFKVDRLARRHVRILARWLSLAQSKAYFWTWRDDDPHFGPYIPQYMQGIWTAAGRSRVKIKALRSLRELILQKIKSL